MVRVRTAIESPSWLAGLAEWLAQRCHEYAQRNTLPGLAAGVVVDDELRWESCCGVADREREAPVGARTLFQIGSVSKTFTATAVVQLRDRGLLALDAPVVSIVPEVDRVSGLPFARRITVRQLLQHSSGLQGDPPPADPRHGPDRSQHEVLEALHEVRLLASPGTEYRYSNLGYRLLAEIVHRIDGRPLPDYVVAEILHPLGMGDSGTTPLADHGVRCARPYRTAVDPPVPVEPLDPALAVGDGDLWSSLRDLGQWVIEQLSPSTGRETRVLSAQSLREMHAGTFVARDGARGLGWGTVLREGGALVAHGGSLDGFASYLCFCPSARLGALLLANGTPTERLAGLAGVLCDTLVAARPSFDVAGASTLDPERYQSLSGWFIDPVDASVVRVEVRGGRLVCTRSWEGGEEEMQPTADPHLFLVDREHWRFVSGPDGEIDCLSARGYPMFRARTS